MICGIGDDRMQRRLLAEPYNDLKLERVVELCLAMEAAAKNVQTLQEIKSTAEVNAVARVRRNNGNNGKGGFSHQDGVCMRCGDTDHHSNSCKFKEAICHYCNTKGHIRRICMKLKKDSKAEGKHLNDSSKTVHQVSTKDEESNSDFDDMCFAIHHNNEPVPPIRRTLPRRPIK
jgi:hypothetical protein